MIYFIRNILTTCFGQYAGRLQGDVHITRIQLLLAVSSSLHNN